jgi:hypothetical protein
LPQSCRSKSNRWRLVVENYWISRTLDQATILVSPICRAGDSSHIRQSHLRKFCQRLENSYLFHLHCLDIILFSRFASIKCHFKDGSMSHELLLLAIGSTPKPSHLDISTSSCQHDMSFLRWLIMRANHQIQTKARVPQFAVFDFVPSLNPYCH